MPNRGGSDQRSLASLGEVVNLEAPLYCGIFVHAIWIGLAILGINLNLLEKPSLNYIAFAATFAVSYIAMSLFISIFRDKLTRKMRYRVFHLIVATCGLLGSLILSGLPAECSAATLVLSVVGALLAAFFLSFETILLGDASRRREPNRLSLITLLSFASALVVLLVLVYYADTTVKTVLLALAPFGAIMFIYKAQHDNISYLKPQEFIVSADGKVEPKEGTRWVETFDNLHISKARFLLLIGRSASLFGITCGLLAYECSAIFLGAPASRLAWELLFAIGSSFIFMFICFRASRVVESKNVLKESLFIVLALMLFSCAIAVAGNVDELHASALVILLLLGSILWLYPASLIMRFRISAPLSYGSFMGTFAIGIAVSALCIAACAPLVPPAALLLCSPVVLACGILCIVSEKQMRRIVVADFADDGNDGEARKSNSGGGTFKQRCQHTADFYLLSQRESQILFLLAKGRNAMYIQEALSIAEGTVRTHMRNISAKLNVHTQQELMDVVDGFPIDGNSPG